MHFSLFFPRVVVTHDDVTKCREMFLRRNSSGSTELGVTDTGWLLGKGQLPKRFFYRRVLLILWGWGVSPRQRPWEEVAFRLGRNDSARSLGAGRDAFFALDPWHVSGLWSCLDQFCEGGSMAFPHLQRDNLQGGKGWSKERASPWS